MLSACRSRNIIKPLTIETPNAPPQSLPSKVSTNLTPNTIDSFFCFI